MAGGELRFAVEDRGAGLPTGVEPRTSASIGLLLIRPLAAQVGGRLGLGYSRSFCGTM
jgi:hypothetical protein